MLKHMPPGPSSGQPRPPTRGLLQQHLRSPQTQPPPPPTQHQHQHQHQQQQQQGPQSLNVSALSTPGSTIASSQQQQQPPPPPPKIIANGGPRFSAVLNTTTTTVTPVNSNNNNNHNQINHNNNNNNNNNQSNHLNTTINSTHNNNNNHFSNNFPNLNSTLNTKHRVGAREALTSLGLLCLVSLLLALLSLIFLLKISPGGRELPPPPPGPSSPEDYIIVYDVTLALCALSLSLNLCCLLVCAIQFLFAVKLVRAPATIGSRGNKYLQKSSVSRVCAVGGFFVSIPIFLTGIILYTFTQFHSTPAIITSILIGIGIVFCGAAMVHNVFVWQKEKTICVRQNPLNMSLPSQISTIAPPPVQFMNHNSSHNISHLNHSHYLSPHHHSQQVQHHQHSLQQHHHQNNHTPLMHASQINHLGTTNCGGPTAITPITTISPGINGIPPAPITPLSPNVSFNHSFLGGVQGPISALSVAGYPVVRTATATPPTPKLATATAAAAAILSSRDASGSISPGMPGATATTPAANLDMSNVTNTSPHELSTLV